MTEKKEIIANAEIIRKTLCVTDALQEEKGKLEEEDEDFTEELLILKRVEENQLACYLDDIEYMNHAIEKMIQKLKEITENESWKVTDCTE